MARPLRNAAVLILVLALASCAAPVWITATSVAAIAGATGAIFTFDDDALKIWNERNPPTSLDKP